MVWWLRRLRIPARFTEDLVAPVTEDSSKVHRGSGDRGSDKAPRFSMASPIVLWPRLSQGFTDSFCARGYDKVLLLEGFQ